VWNAVVGKQFTLDDMVKALIDIYEVDEQTAKNDCTHLLNDWREVGFIED